jgi:YggT family protein
MGGYAYDIAGLVDSLIGILRLGLLIYIILSLLINFNVINGYNQFVSIVYGTLFKIFEPMLIPIRNILPDMGGLDLSPILLFIIIQFAGNILVRFIAGLA